MFAAVRLRAAWHENFKETAMRTIPRIASTLVFLALTVDSHRKFDRLSGWYGRRVAATLRYRAVTAMIVAALSGTRCGCPSGPTR